MTDPDTPANTPEVVATLDDDTGAFCVDILRHPEGHYTFAEYARDADDPEAWHPRADTPAKTYRTQYAAYAAAMRDVDWLME